MEKTNAQIIKKNATNIGLMLGIVLTLSSTLIYVFNIDLYTNIWFLMTLFVVFFLITMIFGIVSVSKSKGALNGFISFKEAFTSYFITILIGTFISSIVSIVIFIIIDPDSAVYIQEKTIEMTVDTMQRFGVPESEIAKTIEEMQKTNNFSFGNQIKSFFMGLVIYSVFGLLVSLIFKRNNPDLA